MRSVRVRTEDLQVGTPRSSQNERRSSMPSSVDLIDDDDDLEIFGAGPGDVDGGDEAVFKYRFAVSDDQRSGTDRSWN